MSVPTQKLHRALVVLLPSAAAAMIWDGSFGFDFLQVVAAGVSMV